MMNPEIKAQWVAALRSGEYVQGRKSLRSLDDEFCCLGVLCALHALDGGPQAEAFSKEYNYGGAIAFPNADTFTWAGLDHANTEQNEACWTLAIMNDGIGSGGGLSFAKIADYIEENF